MPMRLERPVEAKSLASAVSAYQRQHRLQALLRFCPKCGETPLQARERLCADCRAKHRRETHQRYNSHRKRKIGLLNTTVNAVFSLGKICRFRRNHIKTADTLILAT